MALTEALTWLRAHRSKDGSWGYLPGQTGRVEPTVLATAAGAADDAAWLAAQPADFATLLLPRRRRSPAWHEAMVAQAVEHILGSKGRLVSHSGDVVDQDHSLRGWSWYPGTAFWVEPTCYALISLSAVGRSDDPRAEVGRRLLLDRQCADGGWNFGNSRVLGTQLESFLPPTGWACMALPTSLVPENSLTRLLDAKSHRSPLTLSLAILGRGVHGAPVEDLAELLVAMQGPDGDYESRVDWTALAACALTLVEEGLYVFG